MTAAWQKRLETLQALGIEPYPLATAVQPDDLYGRITQISAREITLDGNLQVELLGSMPFELHVGDLVSVQGSWSGKRFAAQTIVLLAPILGPAPAVTAHHAAIKKNLLARHTLNQTLRDFFRQAGFLEVETPALVLSPGTETHLSPFASRYHAADPHGPAADVFLITSPELALKKLLALANPRDPEPNFTKLFQLSKAWRNGEHFQGERVIHNPEFTILEWYRAFADADAIMQDLENLLAACSDRWRPPFRRLAVTQACRDHAGVELTDDVVSLRQRAKQAGMEIPADATWEEVFNRLLIERVEPWLPKAEPFFLVDYPAPVASLAKLQKPAPGMRCAERFELFIGDLEIANGFSELNNPLEQAARFDHDVAERRRRRLAGEINLPDERLLADPEYLEVLRYGLPPSAGVAVGVDRLLMALLDLQDIRATLAYPFHLRRGGNEEDV